ncbi:type 4a pilus biogenesis protein PilO [Herbaspirillum sp. RV1423]|uniref:type 4a pilus biogenesis protein PilO n=1 Tax=Herbaspirillum sp. RV1423 TaxID=1443993 RepID=UPI0006869E55|nr:type 4a pilus biogenesis protein PilO [Herbaspirillum sp. RV1423]
MNPETFIRRLRDLNGRHPATWPCLPQCLLFAAVFLGVLLLGWLLYLRPAVDVLDSAETETLTLKNTFAAKQQQATVLPSLQEQERHLARSLAALEEQLPLADDLSAILGDIGDAALRHQLHFEFARPGKPETKHGYLELPIAIRLGGNYHDIGRFAADIAAMPQLLILNDMRLSATDKQGWVTLEALALTYRRIEADEKKP